MSVTLSEHEPLTRAELRMIGSALGPIQSMVCRLAEADPSRGKAGMGRGRCIWTKAGHRIDFEALPGGGYIAGVGGEPDPDAPPSGTFPVE